VEYREIFDLLIGLLSEKLEKDIHADTEIDRILSADPHTFYNLERELESRAGLKISEQDVISSKTVRDLAQRLALASQGKAKLALPDVGENESGACEYPIWFGTNRCPVPKADGTIEYSGARDAVTHYGRCRILVPKSHKIGSVGSPWWKRILIGSDDRLRLIDLQTLDAGLYWSALNEALASIDPDDRDTVIFIHGYNVSFIEAALRTAQLGFDLSIQGAMTFFSWPSQGLVSGYMADEATIEASEGAITQFLIDVATQCRSRAVHIIAHSMGNRGLLRAVTRITAHAEQQTDVHFDQMILAAPDIDVDVFRELCSAYASVARRTTLYVSARDRAVEASGWLHQYPRVGLTPPICVNRGIDTVNVTNADLTTLGHGYVAEARDVLHDMHDLMTHGAAPDRRFGLRPATTGSGERFWIIGA
jgi:esterase/lipase superfamily enzyme